MKRYHYVAQQSTEQVIEIRRGRGTKWSGRRESNPHYQLGNLYRPGLSHDLTCGSVCPRVTGRDPALGYPIAIFIGPDIEPDAIPAGAKLQIAGPLAGH